MAFKEDLEWLLDAAYKKGQAYYKEDFFVDGGDEKADWDHYEEEQYQHWIKRFLKNYGKEE